MAENRVPCPNCSDGFVTTGDRHARTRQDVCGHCAGAGMVEARTGQTPEASFTPGPMEPDDGWEWAVVEVMGHRRHAGRTREVERFGAKMIRVDIPTKGDPDAHGWTTHFYPGSALFSFTPCTREAALKANKPYEPAARLSYRSAETDWAEDQIDG